MIPGFRQQFHLQILVSIGSKVSLDAELKHELKFPFRPRVINIERFLKKVGQVLVVLGVLLLPAAVGLTAQPS